MIKLEKNNTIIIVDEVYITFNKENISNTQGYSTDFDIPVENELIPNIDYAIYCHNVGKKIECNAILDNNIEIECELLIQAVADNKVTVTGYFYLLPKKLYKKFQELNIPNIEVDYLMYDLFDYGVHYNNNSLIKAIYHNGLTAETNYNGESSFHIPSISAENFLILINEICECNLRYSNALDGIWLRPKKLVSNYVSQGLTFNDDGVQKTGNINIPKMITQTIRSEGWDRVSQQYNYIADIVVEEGEKCELLTKITFVADTFSFRLIDALTNEVIWTRGETIRGDYEINTLLTSGEYKLQIMFNSISGEWGGSAWLTYHQMSNGEVEQLMNTWHNYTNYLLGFWDLTPAQILLDMAMASNTVLTPYGFETYITQYIDEYIPVKYTFNSYGKNNFILWQNDDELGFLNYGIRGLFPDGAISLKKARNFLKISETTKEEDEPYYNFKAKSFLNIKFIEMFSSPHLVGVDNQTSKTNVTSSQEGYVLQRGEWKTLTNINYLFVTPWQVQSRIDNEVENSIEAEFKIGDINPLATYVFWRNIKWLITSCEYSNGLYEVKLLQIT